jgi:hypothetical protein
VGAVALKVTVTQPRAAGFVTVYPDGPPRPGTSSVNFSAGQTVANSVIVAVGAGGLVDFSNTSAGSVQIITDVSGWTVAT